MHNCNYNHRPQLNIQGVHGGQSGDYYDVVNTVFSV